MAANAIFPSGSLHIISALKPATSFSSKSRFTPNYYYYGSNKPPIQSIIASTWTPLPIAVISDGVSAVTSEPEITWQIVIGALAGVIPFVVAGIEFSKRIVEQRNCEVCKGSGLVLRDNKYYFRCPRCGGFLPWQSWRRFFTG